MKIIILFLFFPSQSYIFNLTVNNFQKPINAGNRLETGIIESTENVKKTTENEINDRILEKLKYYDKRKRAQINEKLIVSVSLHVITIADIKQENMQYGLEVWR